MPRSQASAIGSRRRHHLGAEYGIWMALKTMKVEMTIVVNSRRRYESAGRRSTGMTSGPSCSTSFAPSTRTNAGRVNGVSPDSRSGSPNSSVWLPPALLFFFFFFFLLLDRDFTFADDGFLRLRPAPNAGEVRRPSGSGMG